MGIIAGATYREGVAYSPDGAMYVTPTGTASITGGTITGVSGVPYTLAKGGIPLIALSSGSVAANGAISGITALPTVYPNAYCYFPANILATVKAAGWYYCTFSTTTAGVAFLDALPATGIATVPSSPTAVTDGKGAFTGDTGEEFGLTISIPASSVGSSGVIRIHTICLQTNNANVKTQRIRLSGNAGTVFFSNALTSLGSGGFIGQIANLTTASQTSEHFSNTTAASVTSGVNGTVDMTAATTLVFSLQRATATDNIVQYPPIVEVLN